MDVNFRLAGPRPKTVPRCVCTRGGEGDGAAREEEEEVTGGFETGRGGGT